MGLFGDIAADRRRRRNARGLQAFGVPSTTALATPHCRTVRQGGGPTVFTVGYEKRSSDELVSLLVDAGVNVLVDVREHAISRRPEFRAGPLMAACREAGIAYESMPGLGSTETQRASLHETGDIGGFRKRFRTHIARHGQADLGRAAALAKARTIALFCYERCHEECHRSVVADLLADRTNATVVAIV